MTATPSDRPIIIFTTVATQDEAVRLSEELLSILVRLFSVAISKPSKSNASGARGELLRNDFFDRIPHAL